MVGFWSFGKHGLHSLVVYPNEFMGAGCKPKPAGIRSILIKNILWMKKNEWDALRNFHIIFVLLSTKISSLSGGYLYQGVCFDHTIK
ncbi:MAG: hypothetical protein A2W17_01670 [Planctomycetes bacterium RBG_16_41_13]|nr:MAG: hypothetical protein A2W17_01670 [Planctomycetes bacterium RBG_16_41_13]